MGATLRIGIQGGAGSFNHQALQVAVQRQNIQDHEPVFLFTTPAVLSALQFGDIDRGQFALHNSIGGPVQETMTAIGSFTFEVLDWYSFPVAHSLIAKKGVGLSQIHTILTHPQVFRQCAANLQKRYPHVGQREGEDELIDPARVAQALRDHELPDSYATLSCQGLADVYGLRVLDTGLQDSSDNATTFLFVAPGKADVTSPCT